MRRFVWATLAFLLMVGAASADAFFPRDTRVQNEEPGYCGWCSLEMLCRQQGIKAGFDLKEKRKKDPPAWDPNHQVYQHQGLAWDGIITQKLTAMGIKHRIVNGHNDPIERAKARELIRKTIAAGHGVYFEVWGHAMVLTDFDEERRIVRFIDPNNSLCLVDGEIGVMRAGMDWFEQNWLGLVVTVE